MEEDPSLGEGLDDIFDPRSYIEDGIEKIFQNIR
jgi:hypothetical protein